MKIDRRVPNFKFSLAEGKPVSVVEVTFSYDEVNMDMTMRLVNKRGFTVRTVLLPFMPKIGSPLYIEHHGDKND